MQLKGSSSTAAADPQGRAAQKVFAVPQLIPWKERVIRGFAVLFLLYAAYYLYWRWTASLNLQAPVFSIALVTAETLTLLATFFFVFNVWRLKSRRQYPPEAGLSVDVFITTYDEPIGVIRKTAVGATAIRYPHRTYLLDDGRREEVRALASNLGIGYITRSDNAHAKAGNLNHALKHTDGDFILQLDADHVPLPHMLDRLLGYFRDDKIAFVQSPQSFYNMDRFTTLIEPRRRRLFTEQAIFFNVIQPGKDYWNAAFFCGSCAVIRRSALDELGGFSMDTITEDFETSIRLHARGWESAYHAEPLAYGLSPTTAAGFHTQRLRWAQGTMQVWRKYNPLTLSGLSLPQRICYFYSILVYLDGLPRAIFYSAPIIYLLFGTLPIGAVGWSFLYYFLPLYAGSMLLNVLLGRGAAQPFWMLERSNMSKVFTHAAGITGLFGRQRAFRVTPKGANRTPFRVYSPHVTLLAVTTLALMWGTFAYKTGVVSYGAAGVATAVAFLLNACWALWNFSIAGAVVHASITANERRGDHRFPDATPVLVTSGPGGGADISGVAIDLNSSGMALHGMHSIAADETREFILNLATGRLRVCGRVVRSPRGGIVSDALVHGIEFVDLCELDRQQIDLHCTHHSVQAFRARFVEQEDLFQRIRRPFSAPLRREINLPALIEDHDGGTRASSAVLHRECSRAAEFLCAEPIAENTPVSFEVTGTQIRRHGRVERIRHIATGGGGTHLIVVQLDPPVGTAEIKRDEAFPDQELATMPNIRRAVLIFAGLLTASVLSASAQIAGGAILSAESAAADRTFLLTGGWITSDRPGVAPVVSVIGYRHGYPGPTADRVQWGLNPSAGLRVAGSTAGAQATAGYAWQWQDLDVVAAAPELQRVTSGVTTSAQANYWGTGARSAQAIVSYSWGGDGYLWSQARFAQRVSSLGSMPLSLGLEGTAQGNDDFTAWGAGPVLDLGFNGDGVVTFATGLRRSSFGDAASENHWYARLDLVLLR